MVRLWSVAPGVAADNRGSSRTLTQQLTGRPGRSTDHRPVPYNDEISLPARPWSARRSLPGSACPSTRGPTPLLRPAGPIRAAQGSGDPTPAAPPSLESLDGFGEQRDLIELRGTRDQDQLVAAALLEGRNIAPDHLFTDGGAGSNLVGGLAQPTVVVPHVGVGLLPRPRPEREVGKRELARLARAPGRLPGLLHRGRQLGEHLRGAAAHDPAIAEAGGAPQGRLIMAADDQLRPALARRRRPDRPRVAALLTAPDPLQLLKKLLQPTAPTRRREPARLVIVVASAKPDRQHQPTTRKPVKRGGLFGE